MRRRLKEDLQALEAASEESLRGRVARILALRTIMHTRWVQRTNISRFELVLVKQSSSGSLSTAFSDRLPSAGVRARTLEGMDAA